MCFSNCKNETRDGDCKGGRIDNLCHCWDDDNESEEEGEADD